MRRAKWLVLLVVISFLFSSCSVLDSINKLGIENRSRVRLVFSPVDYYPDDSELNEAVSILDERCDNIDLVANVLSEDGNVIVEFASKDGYYSDDLPYMIGSTARLEFRDADENVIMDGSAIEGAVSEYGKLSEDSDKEHYVTLTIKDEYVETWADATEAAAERVYETDESGRFKNYISIYLDDEMQSCPSVTERIESDTCIIMGNFDAESAKQLAGIIKAGQMPFELEFIDSEFIEIGD